MRRRDFLLASAAFALAGSSRVAAQENGKPTSIAVMTWGGQFGDAVAKGADREFESRFGIKVIQDRGSTPVERITKVKINEKNQIFDVMQLHHGLVPLAVQQGAYEKLDFSSPRLSNAKSLIGNFGNDYWVPFIFSEIGVCYTKADVKTPPTKFSDFWRPEFKGRVVLPSITHSIGPYIIPIGAMAAGKDPKDEAAGFEMLQKLVDLNPIWARDTDGIMNAMRSGEAVIGLLYRSQTLTLQNGGSDVQWIAPEEGAIPISWGAGIAKGCRNRPFAEDYLNVMMGPQCQAVFAEAFNYSGTNPNMLDLLTPALRARVTTNAAAMSKLRPLDLAYIADRRAAWTERWNRIVSG
ncbi:MAG: hypothetical protein B7Y12_01720 [Rhizobiales bacterium 24-66-13]|nr:MAG: hypothetical protein B7Y61_02285 [Rhizobiales bacterium 35-66-30]OYZ82851.1 MAG: hypothetical protein B7Y12_01720 [Rhizobiales bacterium 24-66-13]OZB11397.1 MAG: hypothetical protein B7X67_04080 [Rhizobiales bacterium 39-66-18]HQS45724.1 extracellular solute-binding protein [Xanthobacteraceae bacterium]